MSGVFGGTAHAAVSGISHREAKVVRHKVLVPSAGAVMSGVHGRDSGGAGTVSWIESLQLGCACLTLLLSHFELGTAAICCLR